MKLTKIATAGAMVVGLLLGGGGIAQAASLVAVNPAQLVSIETNPAIGSSGGGVYGAEIRNGNNAIGGDWELGIGQGTSRTGNFNQGEFAWNGGAVNFSYDYIVGGTSTLNVGGTSVSWENFELLGNAVFINTARRSSMTIDTINGDAAAFTIGDATTELTGGSLILAQNDFSAFGSFSLAGTLLIDTFRDNGNAATGSFNAIRISTGTVAPVPVPAALPLLLGGLGLLGFVARRRRRAA